MLLRGGPAEAQDKLNRLVQGQSHMVTSEHGKYSDVVTKVHIGLEKKYTNILEKLAGSHRVRLQV